MNYVELIRSWNIPENATLCSCWSIDNPLETILHPGVINEIIIPFEGDAPSTLLQVNNHMGAKPWRVISEYIYFSQHTQSLTIPIITSFLQHLKKGEPICHVELMNPIVTLQNIKGNFFIIKNKNHVHF